LNTQSTEEIIVRTQNIWENLPLHRKGVLSVGTALDGSDGFPTAAAINDLTSKSSDVEMGLIISYQEIDRRRDNFRQDASFGLNPLYDLDDEKALTYFKNIVQVRMQMMGYYSGGVFPSASFDALKEQEKILFETEDFSRIKPMGRVDIFGLKERLERISLLSYSVLGDDLIGVVVSPNGTSVEVLGSVSEIEELVSKHHKAQIASLDTKGFDHSHGHKLRQIIYDPFEVHLQGYGRYMAIGPEFLYQNSYMTLPEQQDGLLFLARNRTVTYLPSLYEINKSASEFGSFESDIVGFARPLKADVDIVADPLMSRTGQPAIVELSRVHFRPDSRMLFTDDKVTQQRYVKNSFSSRFLFVSGLESSKNGGWIFDDQELTISEIQSRKMVVQTVFLSFDPDFESQMRRVRAYMNAGARTVVMSVWRIPQAELRVYLDGIFEALTRDEPLTAALKQGRKQVLKQRLRDEGDSLKPNPSIWGSFIVFGQP
jgi:hypothetical protein